MLALVVGAARSEPNGPRVAGLKGWTKPYAHPGRGERERTRTSNDTDSAGAATVRPPVPRQTWRSVPDDLAGHQRRLRADEVLALPDGDRMAGPPAVDTLVSVGLTLIDRWLGP